MKRPRKAPKILDQIVDAVLAHTPKLKSKKAKKRRRKALKAQRDNG